MLPWVGGEELDPFINLEMLRTELPMAELGLGVGVGGAGMGWR